MAMIPQPRLTPQQVRLLVEASDGTSTSGIAKALRVSEDRVKNLLTAIHTELGVHTRAHAIRRGFEWGFLTSGQEDHPVWTLTDRHPHLAICYQTDRCECRKPGQR